MSSPRTFTLSALLVAALAAPMIAFAADTDRFGNGESMYGRSAPDAGRARVVDVNTAKYINVEHRSTVVFTNGSERFAWTFDGLELRGVKLDKIAPHDFGSTGLMVYVGRDPLMRH